MDTPSSHPTLTSGHQTGVVTTCGAERAKGPAEPPDVLDVDVPAGSRVLITSDLHLRPTPTRASVAAAAELAEAIENVAGPGVVVLAGDVFEFLAEETDDPSGAFAAHPRLTEALAAFSKGEGRRTIVLPGNHDARFAWDPKAAAAVARCVGAEVALAVVLHVHSGRGVERVRVEHGHRFDPPNAFTDPRNPAETPLGHHIVNEVLPLLHGARTAWLEGAEELSDPADFPAFVASRLLYRRLTPHLRWLAVPLLLTLLLRLPALYALADRARPGARTGSWLLGLGVAIAADLVLLGAVVALVARRTYRSAAAVGIGRRGRAQNDAARDEARRLAGSGFAGFVTGHTHHAELTPLDGAFYANTGCGTEVVEERRGRLGLPGVFLSRRQLSWVELEAGADLHVRLLEGGVDVPGGSRLERMVGVRPANRSPRPVVVASQPHGSPWPIVKDPTSGLRRVRRVAAGAIALAGLLDLASALTPPVSWRLRALDGLVPLAVPRAAAALVVLSGLALLALARGVRRGQRHAWTLAVLVLTGSAVLHLLKGADVEETLAAVVVAAYLVRHRAAFAARADWASLRQGLVGVLTGALTALGVGTIAVEAVPGGRPHLLIGDAILAAASRLVGLGTVKLPHGLDMFLTPGLAMAGAGLAVATGWLVFRPAVARKRVATDGDGFGPNTKARDIVRRHGSGTLAYFALRDDKQHFYFGDSLVAYAVLGGVCLVSPDPVGPPTERAAVWAAFRRFTDENGWAVSVLGAGEEWLPTYRSTGMRAMYVGDEGVVNCGRFSLAGNDRKGLRQAVNRVARNGYSVGFHDPAHIDPELRRGLLDVMARSRRGGVERGFSMTLGRAFDETDDGLLLAVCTGPDGQPVAFCQYVPAPGINGYSLDLMRRSPGDHPNGVTDFVVVETIRHLREQGMTGLALNFATMRSVLAREGGNGLAQRLERRLLLSLSDTMQIESLWRYNAKFGPDWHPRFAVYDSPENVIPAAMAVARAESFWELPVIGRFLIPAAPECPPDTEVPAEDGTDRPPALTAKGR